MTKTYHSLKFKDDSSFSFVHDGLPGNWTMIRNNVMRQFHTNNQLFDCPIFELPNNKTIQFSLTQLSNLISWEINIIKE